MQNTAEGQSFHFTVQLNSIQRAIGNILSKVLYKTVTDAEQEKGITGTSWFQIYRKEYNWLQWELVQGLTEDLRKQKHFFSSLMCKLVKV